MGLIAEEKDKLADTYITLHRLDPTGQISVPIVTSRRGSRPGWGALADPVFSSSPSAQARTDDLTH